MHAAPIPPVSVNPQVLALRVAAAFRAGHAPHGRRAVGSRPGGCVSPPSLRILLVDDDAVVLRVLTRVLSLAGAAVTAAKLLERIERDPGIPDPDDPPRAPGEARSAAGTPP